MTAKLDKLWYLPNKLIQTRIKLVWRPFAMETLKFLLTLKLEISKFEKNLPKTYVATE